MPRDTRPSVDLGRLVIRSLSEDDAGALAPFDCGDADLNEFLRDDALRLQRLHTVHTYVAFYDGASQACGYVAVLTDAVILESRERKRLKMRHADHPVVPALKVARLGVDERFRAQHRGLGTALVRYAAAVAYEIADTAGCRLLTLDAYGGSAKFYGQLGFKRNKNKWYRQKRHPSMRLDLFAPDAPRWLTD